MDTSFGNSSGRNPSQTACKITPAIQMRLKFFQTLISSSQFIDHHLSHSLSSDAADHLHILTGKHGGLDAFHFDSPEFPAVSFRFPGYINQIDGPYNNNSQNLPRSHGVRGDQDVTILRLRRLVSKDGPCISLFGSCNGLVCIGKGYCGGWWWEVRVYSLKSDSWSLVEERSSQHSPHLMGGGALVCNHLVHWVFYNELNGQHRIGCFDLRNNQWGDDVPLPIVADVRFQTYRSKKFLVYLGVLDGCLCLLTEHNKGAGVDVWVMNEYGVKDSWVKLVRISTADVHDWLKIPPFVYGKG